MVGAVVVVVEIDVDVEVDAAVVVVLVPLPELEVVDSAAPPSQPVMAPISRRASTPGVRLRTLMASSSPNAPHRQQRRMPLFRSTRTGPAYVGQRTRGALGDSGLLFEEAVGDGSA